MTSRLGINNEHFAINLRLLCDRYPSVAHVCRQININRQQFNKYLSGQIYPSRYNLQRICAFFNVEEEQLTQDFENFEACLKDRNRHQSHAQNRTIVDEQINLLPNAVDTLRRYTGYYYSHFHALGFPKCLLRSLVHLYEYDGRFYTNSIEHLWNRNKPPGRKLRFKYSGIALYLADRIFISEYETLTKNTICQTILFPSYRNEIDTLSGISTGVSSLNSHIPKSTRVEYQYLGKEISVKKALRQCGLFDIGDPEIDLKIQERINNDIKPGEYMLTAVDQ